MASRRFEEQRADNLERARRSHFPESVAQLLAVVQEPRFDGESSSEDFDASLSREKAGLRNRLDAATRELGLAGQDKIGGIVEVETTKAARSLIVAAEAASMPKTAELLRSALNRCRVIPQQRPQEPEKPEFPQPKRVLDPRTGRPIGLWR